MGVYRVVSPTLKFHWKQNTTYATKLQAARGQGKANSGVYQIRIEINLGLSYIYLIPSSIQNLSQLRLHKTRTNGEKR